MSKREHSTNAWEFRKLKEKKDKEEPSENFTLEKCKLTKIKYLLARLISKNEEDEKESQWIWR